MGISLEFNKKLFKSLGRGGKTEMMRAGKCEKGFQKYQETLYTSWKYENVLKFDFLKTINGSWWFTMTFDNIFVKLQIHMKPIKMEWEFILL